jgi:hypothetical protein
MSSEQQSLNKTAVNLYGILDNELSRMHELMRVYLTLPKEDIMTGRYASTNTTAPMGEIYKRITALQDLLLQSVISHDKVLQEKIAELALTGVDNGYKR